MARAGADLVGLNCLFDPFIMLDCMKVMKDAMDKEGLHPFLMCQPLGYKTADAGHYGSQCLKTQKEDKKIADG